MVEYVTEDIAVAKWIRADASDASAFDSAQHRWGRAAGCPGFVGQLGGWSSRDPRRAVVVALWNSRAAHEAFLATVHDGLARDQRRCYTSIAVDLLDRELDSPPTDRFPPVDGMLRTVAGRLRPGRLEHVLEVQREVWFPAMREAGMRWGLLARPGTSLGDDLVVVMTTWPSRQVHHEYQRQRVPELRARAAVHTDFVSLDGDLVALTPSWTVTARGSSPPEVR